MAVEIRAMVQKGGSGGACEETVLIASTVGNLADLRGGIFPLLGCEPDRKQQCHRDIAP